MNKQLKYARMKSSMIKGLGIASATLSLSQIGIAGGTDTWFIPLTESASVTFPNSLEEFDAPWVTPAEIVQTNLMSMLEVETDPSQSVVRVPAGTSASMFDMIAYDDDGQFIFIPHETPFGAGVSRYDIGADETQVLFKGDWGGMSGDWSADYGAFDPCRFTPNRTLFLAEEWAGQGRVIEVLNPFDDPEKIEIRELHSIANVSHEGINFSYKEDKVIYFVDENNSGSIYRFVMKNKGDYTSGQTSVLKVDAFDADEAGLNWNDEDLTSPRTGNARWIPITNANGKPLPGIPDAFAPGSGSGRAAADAAGGTPYGRPEDMEIGTLNCGNEVLYVCATSEQAVYAIETLRGNRAKVWVCVSNDDTPKNAGFAPTTGVLNSPDNLAQDAMGNIYVIEDAPNGSSTGGDIWFIRDTDNDGVGESLDHFMSIRVDGCEATGMIFNPVNPTEYSVAVQHPDSVDIISWPDGVGDAIWKFVIEDSDFLDALED